MVWRERRCCAQCLREGKEEKGSSAEGKRVLKKKEQKGAKLTWEGTFIWGEFQKHL